MKITQIAIQNILGAKNVSVSAAAPVLVFAGDNFSGKSSTREAIYQAMSENYLRIGLKKDFAKLISDDQKKGMAVIQFEGGQASISLPKGTHNFSFDGINMSDAELMQESMPYCLNSGAFSAIENDERRKFLFKLMKVKTGMGVVQKMLIDAGCDADKLNSILPMLASGFKAAEDEAMEKAKEFRTLWKNVTKENYGSEKAETWTANTESDGDTPQDVSTINIQINEVNSKIEKLISQAATRQEELRAKQALDKQIADLRVIAATKEFAAESLQNDENALASYRAEIVKVRHLATGETPAITHVCPCCNMPLSIVDGALTKYEAPEKLADSDAKAKLPSMENTLRQLEAAYKASIDAVKQADEANVKLSALDTTNDDAPVSQENIDGIRADITNLKIQAEKLRAEKLAADAINNAASEASKKTETAKKYHADVMAYSKIAKQLAPEGIPTKLLENAIAPFNAELAKSAEVAYWLPASIDKDMNILYGGRAYALCSESEKWRCDAMISEIIAQFSGLKFIMLDRFDCLNAAGLIDMIEWLQEITAHGGSIDTAIVFGTMKEKPVLPETCQVIWMENGTAISDSPVAGTEQAA